MIVVPEGSSWLVVTQPDHAHFAGELLSLWRAGGLPSHPRRAEILFAAREHDNGWREADAAPRWNAEQGRPHDFLTLPRQDRIEIWERGVCRFAADRPYAALLITRHALNLFQGRRDEEAWTPFLDFLADFERGLHETVDVPAAELEADYRLIDLTDLISLTACNRWREPAERYGTRIEPGDAVLRLDPFPLAGATTFRIPCRRIPARPFSGDADLGGELATARWGEMTIRVAEALRP